MKKLLGIGLLLLATIAYAGTVTVTAKKGGTTINVPASKVYEVIQKNYEIQDEGTLLTNMYAENYSLTKNTVSVSPTTYTTITYTANSVTVATTSPDAVNVKAAMSNVKIGSIIETAHSPLAQGLVKEINGYTIVVDKWFNSTTTAAITPSPTTGTAFYINDWVDQSPLRYKKLTGTTGATGSALQVAHGLTGSKIVSITGKVKTETNSGINAGTTTGSGIYFYELSHDTTYAAITLGTSATAITEKPAVIYITYEE